MSAGVFAPGYPTELARIVLSWRVGLYFVQALRLFPEAPAGPPCSRVCHDLAGRALPRRARPAALR
jgi:hypothetical protein